MPTLLDRTFKLNEHGTSVKTEILAGVTTFLTMAYILFVKDRKSTRLTPVTAVSRMPSSA